MDPSALDPARPHAFYLADPSLEALSDCFATIDGTRLPLHSQVLSMQSGVLRELFLAQREGLASAHEHPDLSAAFEGSSIEGAACLLRLLLRTQEVGGGSFAALLAAGQLPALAALAHKLDVPAVLSALEQHLQGMRGGMTSTWQLLVGLLVAQRCRFDETEAMLVDVIAGSTAQVAALQPAALAGLDGPTLARLLVRQAQVAQQRNSLCPSLLEARMARAGQPGGFTFGLWNFDQHQHACTSPWVEVTGQLWRLLVYPRGAADGVGTHLSACVQWDSSPAAAGVSSLSAGYSLTVCRHDQGGPSRWLTTSATHSALFTSQAHVGGAPAAAAAHPAVRTWGVPQLLPLHTLQSAGIVEVRLDMTVMCTLPAAA